MKKKIILLFSCALFLHISLFSQIYTKQQVFQADHWVYQALKTIALADSYMVFYDTAPISAAEIKFHMSNIDYDALDDNSRILYDRLNEYLNTNAFSLDFAPVKVGINLQVNPTLHYKSNKQMEWDFASTYAGNTYKKYNEDGSFTYEKASYGNESTFNSSQLIKPFIIAPVYISIADAFVIETDPAVWKNYWSMNDNDNFINLPLAGRDFDFLWPKVAYFNTGYIFNSGWGINLLVERSGYQIGDTLTGSIIYNSSFETDVFCNLSAFTKNFKYTLSLIEVNNDRFLYLHKIDAILFKRLKCSFLEGTFINHSFELRYINPLMIMHSWGSWRQYRSPVEYEYYSEAHVSAYLGMLFELVPFDNFRIYGMFSQNEIQTFMELGSPYSYSLPDGIGFQVGVEYNLADKHNGWWTFAIEGVYTSPFLYVKQGKEWSLISYRENMQRNANTPLYSWIGSPFGPDCLAFESKVSYKQYDSWGLDFRYLFVAHGENSFAMFNSTFTNKDGTFWAYYPSVLRLLGLLNDDQAIEMAREMGLTGVVQYTNRFTLSGFYSINEHIKLDADVSYNFIFNSQNQLDNFIQGIQLYCGFEYKLF